MTTHTATELTSPHDLLAAVPFMVGYHPKDSLVVMALVENKVAMAMRVDFPELDSLDAMSEIIASHLMRERATEAIIVGYLPEEFPTLGVANALSIINDRLSAHQIKIKESIEVRGDRFRSMKCSDELCCPPEGTPLPPLTDSRVTAEQVAAGNPLPFLDLDEMKKSIAHTATDRNLVLSIKGTPEIDYDQDDVTVYQQEGVKALHQMVSAFTDTGICNDNELIAVVLVRLLDLQVRDYAMGMTTPETSDLLWDMWRWLLRIAPVGYVAPVGVIFATMSYERGDGALAQRALDRAFEDKPGYQMAKLLRRTFAAGWPPSAFSQMRADLHPKICAAIFADSR